MKKNIFVTLLMMLAHVFGGDAFAQDRGEQVYKSVCSSCHTLNPPPSTAPPVRGIVMNYSRAVQTRDAFISEVTRWAKSPARERSHMVAAIDRFGLMPPFPLADEDLQAVAGWMWDVVKGETAQPLTMEKRAELFGQGLSQDLMKTIRGALEAALAAGGPEHAFDVCSEQAIPLTEGINAKQDSGIRVKRVTDRARSPENVLDEEDTKQFKEFARTRSKEPVTVLRANGDFRYYRPIYIEPLCLTCHGNKSKFSEHLLRTLATRYPHDAATGYAEGDLRGLVRVDIPSAICAGQ